MIEKGVPLSRFWKQTVALYLRVVYIPDTDWERLPGYRKTPWEQYPTGFTSMPRHIETEPSAEPLPPVP